jgi:hypothetical protein
MYCPSCGEKIKDPNQKFCQSCGASLKSEAKTSKSHEDKVSKKSESIPSKEYTPSDAALKSSNTHSKRCFTLAIISFILSLLSIIIGLSLYFYIGNSVREVYNPFELLFFLYFYPIVVSYIPQPIFVLDEALKMIAIVFGIIFILFCIASVVLGIVSLVIRKKAKNLESNNSFLKAGIVLAILGIIQAVIGGIISGFLLALPFFINFVNATSTMILY